MVNPFIKLSTLGQSGNVIVNIDNVAYVYENNTVRHVVFKTGTVIHISEEMSVVEELIKQVGEKVLPVQQGFEKEGKGVDLNSNHDELKWNGDVHFKSSNRVTCRKADRPARIDDK